MKTKQGLAVLFLVFIPMMLFSGCAFGVKTPYIDFAQTGETPSLYNKNESSQRPILIALASVLSPHETITYYREIAMHVSRKTGRPAVLVQRKTYAEVNMLLANGDVDIAFMSTGAYSSYRGMNEIELLVMAEYGGSTLYNAEVIVPKDSSIQSIDDLQGKVFAFTDPLSYSGHMVVEDYLHKKSALPETFFKRFFYTYSHDKSLWAVANKLADGASFDSQIYEYAKIKTPDLVDKVRIIATIGPAPTGPIAVKKSMSVEQKEQLRSIFLDMHNDADTNNAMQKLIIHRFVMPTPDLYEPLKKLYDRTSRTL
ncbi:MAG: phosphonate transporter, periplasmic phosphonate-binding protein [Sporomusa sp.]|jgi:phosphonate transport system substrate-binding protein|nr:phosphonate transporter, periplasmic phosphonate-binding protein [Sporomusa sp.]